MPPLMPPPAIHMRKALDVVIAAVALGHRRAAELAAPDDQRVVEHAALLQISDQRRSRLIDFAGDALRCSCLTPP